MQDPVHCRRLHTHGVISVFDWNLNIVWKKFWLTQYPRISPLPVHIPMENIHVENMETALPSAQLYHQVTAFQSY